MKKASKQTQVSARGLAFTNFRKSSHDSLSEGWGYVIDFRKLDGMNAFHIT
jgi:hypothetical protein